MFYLYLWHSEYSLFNSHRCIKILHHLHYVVLIWRLVHVMYGTWGDVARGAHNSEGFALAGEDLGDAKVTNLDMIQGPYTKTHTEYVL
jgi:hypothetical protein